METPRCLKNNPFIVIRSLRILNMVLLSAGATATLILNEHGHTYDTLNDENDLVTISLAVSFTLLAIASLLLVLHWTRVTLKASVNLWFTILVICGIVAFIFFIIDTSNSTVCDENDECFQMHSVEASAAFKFLSMLIWFFDAVHLKHVNYKLY